MKKSLQQLPHWAQRALQGVTYWIGHRRCLYRNYPLAEGALVAEICNLIHANLTDELVLLCEVQYTDLLGGKVKPSVLTQRARADLVVAVDSHDDESEPVPKFIIEVKRSSAPRAQIDADLRRIAAVRETHATIRCFLFLVAEAKRPNRFVTEDGKSRLGKHDISGSNGYYRVRRTWKAAHAFSHVEHAQYACLLEVDF
jgi:hypothetical protein